MRQFNTILDWKVTRSKLKGTLGFVPTMGALHKGHLELIRKAIRECDHVVVSIYVNPTQFDKKEDLDKYPQVLDQDIKLLKDLGVGYLITPTYQEIYSDGFHYKITEDEGSKILCGASRKGHFDGVLTIVMKLLNITKADKAYFGEKDFQQLQLIRGMVDAFFIDVEIVGCPIVRDEKGVALSSRNRRLSEKQLEFVAENFSKRLEKDSIDSLKSHLSSNGIEVDYLEEHWGRRFAAVWCDGVRLIDNAKI